MTHTRLILLVLFCFSIQVDAQWIWDINRLAEVKKSITQPEYKVAYESLLKDANKGLKKMPESVMDKEAVPASGNKHDYLSMGRYFWPDPSKPNGKPYINRDGESNPELEKLDRTRLARMTGNVTTLSLAYYFSGDEQYAAKAVQQLRVWFINKNTKMNPNLNYAQIVPGKNGDKGRGYGVLDGYSFVEMLDAVQLLNDSKSFTSKDKKALKGWFTEFVHWLVTSELGKEERNATNNHGLAFDCQVVAYALYTGNRALANEIIDAFPANRLFKHIEPDGSQPHELRRTLAFGYSEYNIRHMLDLFFMAQKSGKELYNVTSSDGRTFYKAVDFLTPYLGKDVSAWPYKQISGWEGKQQELCLDLFRIALLDSSRLDYLTLYYKYAKRAPADRNILIYGIMNKVPSCIN